MLIVKIAWSHKFYKNPLNLVFWFYLLHMLREQNRPINSWTFCTRVPTRRFCEHCFQCNLVRFHQLLVSNRQYFIQYSSNEATSSSNTSNIRYCFVEAWDTDVICLFELLMQVAKTRVIFVGPIYCNRLKPEGPRMNLDKCQ